MNVVCPTCGHTFRIGASYGKRNGKRMHVDCMTPTEAREHLAPSTPPSDLRVVAALHSDA
ncbi:MAG: hypothetical protein MUQ27_12150 [Acidimicrobiia bacterium]|nr:hypothetical protein [Acidimicrobiia bacterium]